MLGQYLITFREVFEAALITSIMIAFLVKTNNEHLKKQIWIGVGISVIASIITGLFIFLLFDGLSQAGEKLFEALAAFVAVALLTWMILWMITKGTRIQNEIEEKIDHQLIKGPSWGLIGLTVIFVFREGFETVIFLTPFSLDSPLETFAGLILGVISALILSILIYRFGMNISIKKFFTFTSIILILLAAGLLGYGVHELFEYFEVIGIHTGWIGTTAFDLGIQKGSVFHHKGIIGSIFGVMFGYSVKMEWGRIIFHSLYLLTTLPLFYIIRNRMIIRIRNNSVKKMKKEIAH